MSGAAQRGGQPNPRLSLRALVDDMMSEAGGRVADGARAAPALSARQCRRCKKLHALVELNFPSAGMACVQCALPESV